MKTKKTIYALCNSRMEPVMYFSDQDQMERWIANQKEKHGAPGNCMPCQITTTVETREIQ